MTDEFKSCCKAGKKFARHGVIKHKLGIYKNGDVTTNTVEGFFAILKRGVYGTFHHISKQHMQKYVDEFQFRYNRRKIDDGARTLSAIAGAEGKRLTYR